MGNETQRTEGDGIETAQLLNAMDTREESAAAAGPELTTVAEDGRNEQPMPATMPGADFLLPPAGQGATAHRHRRSSTLLHTETESQVQRARDEMRLLAPDDSVPLHCWVRRLSAPMPLRSKHKASVPPPLESLTLLPIGYRVGRYIHRERSAGRLPIFDLSLPLMQPPNPGPYGGVPLGGMGGGCIGRGFRGDFRRWNIWPGRYRSKAVLADQFSVRCKPVGGSGASAQPKAAVLSVEAAEAADPELRSWNWGLDPKCCTYAALYPRSWQYYDAPVEGIRLCCRQISPVFPNEYRRTSMPACVFEWTIENTSAVPMEVSLMFTFQNGTGLPADAAGGHSNRPFTATAPADGAAVPKPFGTIPATSAGSGGGRSVGAAPAVSEPSLVRGIELSHRLRSTKVYEMDIEHEEQQTSCFCCRTTNGPKKLPKDSHEGYEDDLTFSIAAATPPPAGRSAGGANSSAEIPKFSEVEVTACSQFATGYHRGHGMNGNGTTSNGYASNGRSGENDVADPSGEIRVGGSAGAAAVREGDALAPSARDVWRNFVQKGSLPEKFDGSGFSGEWSKGNGCDYPPHRAKDSAAGESIGAALCQKVTVEAGQITVLAFSLSWDCPLARFGSGYALPRRYTRFFGRTGDVAPLLAARALADYREWEERITSWQAPILEDPHLPDFYKYTLFNELYFITDGGTVWLDATDGTANPHEPLSLEPLVGTLAQQHADETCDGIQAVIGQFLYLEGHEYAMYNTYDVHFYASFALAMLWPMLQLSLQRDIALSVGRKDACYRTLLGEGDYRPRKVPGIVPHDLGSPAEQPYAKVNAYVFQDVSRWKDLGPKFVLQVYRDYVASGSRKFLSDMWPVVLHVMKFTEAWDVDGDGLIENQGFPDQTFDIWTVSGPSAYTGGLWLAAVSATKRMAETLKESEKLEYYTELLERGQLSYVEKLWNGRYFDYDSSNSGHSKSIMADQMAGQWYTRACGLEPVVDEKLARTSLRTVYEYNVQRFGNGLLGAVNGMRPDGTIDNSCLQSREVWTGVTYACGACMLHEAAVALEGLPEVQNAALTNSSRSPARPLVGQTTTAAGLTGRKGGPNDNDVSPVKPSMYKQDSANISETERKARQQEGAALRLAAFETIRGLHEAGWNDLGYWFQMPEGWERTGNYRSLGYMRALAIWAMQWAIEHESILLRNVYVKEEGDVVFEEEGTSELGDTASEQQETRGAVDGTTIETPGGGGVGNALRSSLRRASFSLLGRGASTTGATSETAGPATGSGPA